MFPLLQREIRTEGLTRLLARFWARYPDPIEYIASSLLALLIAFFYHDLCEARGASTSVLAFAISWASAARLSHPVDRFARSFACGTVAGFYLYGMYDVIILAVIAVLVAGISSVPDSIRSGPLARNGLYRILRVVWSSTMLFAFYEVTGLDWLGYPLWKVLTWHGYSEEFGPLGMCILAAYIVGGLLLFRVTVGPLFGGNREGIMTED